MLEGSVIFFNEMHSKNIYSEILLRLLERVTEERLLHKLNVNLSALVTLFDIVTFDNKAHRENAEVPIKVNPSGIDMLEIKEP